MWEASSTQQKMLGLWVKNPLKKRLPDPGKKQAQVKGLWAWKTSCGPSQSPSWTIEKQKQKREKEEKKEIKKEAA